MKFPLHRIEIETDSEQELDRAIQRELNSLPTVVQQAYSDQDRFSFRLAIENFIVGLLKEIKTTPLRSRHWQAPRYTLILQWEKTQGLINFNGQEIVIPFTDHDIN